MDKYEQLERLQKLKEQGVLSETEFEVEKLKVLQYETPNVSKTVVHQSQSLDVKKPNGFGIAGFIGSIVGGVFWPVAVVGLVLSIIGVSQSSQKYRKGLAIAGLVISIVAIIGWAIIIFYLAHQQDKTGNYSKYY